MNRRIRWAAVLLAGGLAVTVTGCSDDSKEAAAPAAIDPTATVPNTAVPPADPVERAEVAAETAEVCEPLFGLEDAVAEMPQSPADGAEYLEFALIPLAADLADVATGTAERIATDLLATLQEHDGADGFVEIRDELDGGALERDLDQLRHLTDEDCDALRGLVYGT